MVVVCAVCGKRRRRARWYEGVGWLCGSTVACREAILRAT